MSPQEIEEAYLQNHQSDISMEELLIIDKQPFEKPLAEKQFEMKRESWIKNVMRIQLKSREESEILFDKIFKGFIR